MPNVIPPRGVRKVSELITQHGRTLILSEEDASKLSWTDIPVSTLKINPNTGVISVKLEGQTDWVPAGIKNDGTISLVKDSKIVTENYTITSVDTANKTFSYTLESGDVRNSVIDDTKGFIFELENGSYQPERNQVEAVIDDILLRSKASGGLVEVSEIKVGIKDPLVVGQEITLKYITTFRIGNPYPRFFLNSNEPDPRLAETGDFWLDYDATIASELGGDNEPDPSIVNRRIYWDDISGKPDTLYGFGIKDHVSLEGHRHRRTDIIDFPTSLPANGGNADSVSGYRASSNAPNTLAILGSDGKLPITSIPQHYHNVDEILGLRSALSDSEAKVDQSIDNIRRLEAEINRRTNDAIVRIENINPLNKDIQTAGSRVPSLSVRANINRDEYDVMYTGGGIQAGNYRVTDLIEKLVSQSHSHSIGHANCNCRCRCDNDHGR